MLPRREADAADLSLQGLHALGRRIVQRGGEIGQRGHNAQRDALKNERPNDSRHLLRSRGAN